MVGLAVTLAPVAALNPVEGDQEYVFAPFAMSVVNWPAQRVTFGETVTTGIGFTVTVICAEAEHPVTEPTTV